MKERITYILADGEQGINPANVLVEANSVTLPGVKAAKEWRLTLSTSDLPDSIQEVLKTVHELHVRWASQDQVENPAPFSSRSPPGLHVFYTPLKSSSDDDVTHSPALCDEIKSVFGAELKCNSTAAAFSRQDALSERFAMSSAFQYYQQLPIIEDLTRFISLYYCSSQKNKTGCLQRVHSIRRAASLQFDFDAISQSVVVTALWPPAHQSGKDVRRSTRDRVEIGILNREQSTEEEEIALGGFLTVLGEDDEPKPTLFSFPSRHHQLPATGAESLSFTTSFRHPTGLHPTLQLHFDKSNIEPPNPSCALHAYLTLPSTLFVDRYQFSDQLFLGSQHLAALRSLSGETDLEAPDWVINRWGSAALFELATPEEGLQTSEPWTVNIPLHLRYLPPRSSANMSGIYPDYLAVANRNVKVEDGKRATPVPYPAVFWACPAESGLKMAVNPFDRTNLGYDGLFGPKTLFWHVKPKSSEQSSAPGRLDVLLHVPVLDMSKTRYVESITGIAVVLGFAWVCWKLIAGTLSKGGSPAPVKENKKE